MRSIFDLLNEDRVLWVYLRDTAARQQFAGDVSRMGAAYANGTPVTRESCSPVMALRADRKVRHLMIRIWNASFEPDFPARYLGDASRILRVDYAKFIAGEPEYLCTQSAFRPVCGEFYP